MASTTGTILCACYMTMLVARNVLIMQESSCLLRGRAMDGLPPTQDALIQHNKRTTYQAGHCWAQTMIAAPELPSLTGLGWKKKTEGGWEISWTTPPEATQACRELVRCGCKKGCRRHCKCQKACLQCTTLCLCGGLYTN